MTDTLKLKSILVQNQLTMGKFASLLNISKTSLSYKVNNIREFKSSEIKNAQIILKLSDRERDEIFFATAVEF